MTKNQSERNNALSFLKLMAIIQIVFHHYQQYTAAEFSFGINFFGGWFDFGYVTELFFAVSGYLIYKYMQVIQKGSLTLGGWCAKRAARLLPVTAVTAVVYEGLLFVYHMIDYVPRHFLLDLPLDLWGMVRTMLGLQVGFGFGDPYINGPVWYISVLLSCYIVFYVATKLAQKLGCSPIYIFIAVILIGMSPLCQSEIAFLTSYNARGYYAFFTGVILAHYIAKCGVSKKLAMFAAAVFALLTAVFVVYRFAVVNNLPYVLTFMLYPSLIILCETDFAKRLFRHSIWQKADGVVFNVYVWHVPVILLWFIVIDVLKITPDFSNVLIMLGYTAAAFAVGALSHWLVEKPLNKVVQGYLKKL